VFPAIAVVRPTALVLSREPRKEHFAGWFKAAPGSAAAVLARPVQVIESRAKTHALMMLGTSNYRKTQTLV
jgi:hypothetical protein